MNIASRPKALVIGASGFLGSHVARAAIASGAQVRVMLRPNSPIRGIYDLDVDLRYGGIFDPIALQSAMSGCDVVYYSVIDAGRWLHDPGSAHPTNVDGLRHVLEAATAANLKKFVFIGTTATLASRRAEPITNDDPHQSSGGDSYIESRVVAEQLVLEYATTRGLPAVTTCVSTSYGPDDWRPTPHGSLIARVVAGTFPFYFDVHCDIVGIHDAARAMLLAAEYGQIGQRYIISDRCMHTRDILQVAAEAVGARVPTIELPLPMLYTAARANDLAAQAMRGDMACTSTSLRLAQQTSRLVDDRAEHELDWTPRPVEESIVAAARFFRDQHR